MAYRLEKEPGGTTALVFDGWAKGIAPSPHLGIGNMQNINISTESGEALVDYARFAEDQAAISSGTFSADTSSRIDYTDSPALILGEWVTITSSSISNLSAGTYYVITLSNGFQYQLSTTVSSSDIVTGLGLTGTATFNTTTTHFTRLVASATDTQSANIPVYFMMDANGVVLYRNTNVTYWQQLMPSGPSSGGATGLCAFNGYLFRFYTASTSNQPTIDYTLITNIVAGNPVTFTVLGNMISTNIHQALSGHDNTMYYTDGQLIGSISPAFSAVSGYWTLDHGTSATVFYLTITSGSNLVNGMPVTLASTGTMPSGINPNFTYYIANASVITANTSLTGSYLLSTGISAGATSGTLAVAWPFATTAANQGILVTFSDGERRIATFTNNSTTFTWTTGLSNNVSAYITIPGPNQSFSLSTTKDGANLVSAGTNGTGLLTLASIYFNPTVNASFTWNKNALQLPNYEIAQCMAELGTNLMIGGTSANLYPWDRSSTTATSTTTSSFFYPLILPENNTVQLVTVNNMLYVFCGYKGNIYICNGSSISPAITVPDYVTGQIEPFFTWGATMYLRGRIFFSIQAPNCGGVWSFTPTLNQLSIGQDVGVQLRLENENSNGTYSGMATVLLPKFNQDANGPQYWSGTWNGSTTYNIDFSSTTPYTGGQAIIETDIAETGTMLQNETFSQIEYKLAAPLVAGESVAIKFRKNITDAFASCGTLQTVSATDIAGYYSANFESTQWLQLQIILTSTTSNPSFVRLTEVRVRAPRE